MFIVAERSPISATAELLLYKCSAVAEMGDRVATIDTGRKVRAAVPLFRGGIGEGRNPKQRQGTSSTLTSRHSRGIESPGIASLTRMLAINVSIPNGTVAHLKHFDPTVTINYASRESAQLTDVGVD